MDMRWRCYGGRTKDEYTKDVVMIVIVTIVINVFEMRNPDKIKYNVIIYF